MAINKIDFAGNTLIDLTGDTVTADTLSEGVVAHGADGEVVTGTLKVTGVYIGSGDMPDDCVLQIDPDGATTTEEWVFTLADGTIVTKKVYLDA